MVPETSYIGEFSKNQLKCSQALSSIWLSVQYPKQFPTTDKRFNVIIKIKYYAANYTLNRNYHCLKGSFFSLLCSNAKVDNYVSLCEHSRRIKQRIIMISKGENVVHVRAAGEPLLGRPSCTN